MAMLPSDDDRDDADVPELAVRALTEAHQRALRAGRPLVFVRNDKLIRIDEQGGVTILKELPARIKVTVRQQSARP
jgi:hypothetical protein